MPYELSLVLLDEKVKMLLARLCLGAANKNDSKSEGKMFSISWSSSSYNIITFISSHDNINNQNGVAKLWYV